MDYFAMYQDIWKFHKKFIKNIRDDPKFWESVVDESGSICEKWNNHSFIKNLFIAELKEFDRLYRLQRETVEVEGST